eukprot:GFYU01002361.1.p1 GENE.GFYU01002361.1~~GFYU01002361.1.p1  ORF type:complete len:610 (-),score=192.69 GFYU01002361.1:104-1933(-)
MLAVESSDQYCSCKATAASDMTSYKKYKAVLELPKVLETLTFGTAIFTFAKCLLPKSLSNIDTVPDGLSKGSDIRLDLGSCCVVHGVCQRRPTTPPTRRAAELKQRRQGNEDYVPDRDDLSCNSSRSSSPATSSPRREVVDTDAVSAPAPAAVPKKGKVMADGKAMKVKKAKKDNKQKNLEENKKLQEYKDGRMKGINDAVKPKFVQFVQECVAHHAATVEAKGVACDSSSPLRMDALIGDRLCQVYSLLQADAIAYLYQHGYTQEQMDEVELVPQKMTPLVSIPNYNNRDTHTNNDVSPFADSKHALEFALQMYFLNMYPKKLSDGPRCNFFLDKETYGKVFSCGGNWVESKLIRVVRKYANSQAVAWMQACMDSTGVQYLPPKQGTFQEMTCYDSFKFVVDYSIGRGIPVVCCVSKVCDEEHTDSATENGSPPRHWHHYKAIFSSRSISAPDQFRVVDALDDVTTSFDAGIHGSDAALIVDADSYDGTEEEVIDFEFSEDTCRPVHSCENAMEHARWLQTLSARSQLLANAAIYDHEHGLENGVSSEYGEHVAFSQQHGCGIRKMSDFIIRHIFCNVVKDQMAPERRRFQRLDADCKPCPVIKAGGK